MIPFDNAEIPKCLWDWDLAFPALSVDEVLPQVPVGNVWKSLGPLQP